jgi:hypothetical protein
MTVATAREAAPTTTGLLAPLHEVNEVLLDYLVQAARGRQPRSFRLSLELLDLLQDLEVTAMRRAAQCNFLLVDLEFHRGEWWRAARDSLGHERAPAHSASTGILGSLTRATLTLGWHCARIDHQDDHVRLGLSPAVAAVLASLQLAEIEQLAEQHIDRLQPRWADRPAVWRQLLRAARANDTSAMHSFTVHGVQLAIGDLMAAPRFDPIAGRAPLHSHALRRCR